MLQKPFFFFVSLSQVELGFCHLQLKESQLAQDTVVTVPFVGTACVPGTEISIFMDVLSLNPHNNLVFVLILWMRKQI